MATGRTKNNDPQITSQKAKNLATQTNQKNQHWQQTEKKHKNKKTAKNDGELGYKLFMLYQWDPSGYTC